MKIVHVIPSLRKGGAERIVLDICNQLEKIDGITCVLVTFRPDNSYTFLSENSTIKTIPATVLPSLKKKNQVDVAELQAFIDRFDPDVIHSHLFETEMVLSQIQTNALRVVHFHNNMRQMKKWGMGVKLNKQAITDAYERRIVLGQLLTNRAIAIAVSKDTFTYVHQNLPKTVERKLLPNAINYIRFFNEVQTKPEHRLVMTGSLVPNKDQELAIRVVDALNKRSIKVQLDLMGDGIEKARLFQLTKDLELESQVHFHGNVDHPEEILAKGTVYLHTAIRESFGLVLIEAMAAGLPVVCTNGGGNSDIVVEGKNGFLVEARSAEQLADKIESLLTNEEHRLQMGKYAQEFAQQFDIGNYAQKLLDIYRS